jgi:hypothetical protein
MIQNDPQTGVSLLNLRSPSVIVALQGNSQSLKVMSNLLEGSQVRNHPLRREAKPSITLCSFLNLNLKSLIADAGRSLFGNRLRGKINEKFDLVGLRKVRASLSKLGTNRVVKVRLFGAPE